MAAVLFLTVAMVCEVGIALLLLFCDDKEVFLPIDSEEDEVKSFLVPRLVPLADMGLVCGTE